MRPVAAGRPFHGSSVATPRSPLCFGVIPYGKLWSFELNLQKKKKQHFVWRKYLKGWSENDSIYCLMDGRIFKPGLMGVGQERYFYKLKELRQHILPHGRTDI